VINEFNENDNLNNPTFEFANEFDGNSDNSSLVDEFNANANDTFDFSSMENDNAIIDDYEKGIENNDNQNYVSFDDNKQNDDAITLNYNGIGNDDKKELEDAKIEDSDDSFNEDIFNDIKNDTFDYADIFKYDKIPSETEVNDVNNEESSQNYDIPVENDKDQVIDDNNADVDFKDNYIPFDASIFDNASDENNDLNVNFSANENEDNTQDDSNINLNNDDREDLSNKQEDIKTDEESKEDIYNQIDNSIKELDANTDFTVDDNNVLSTDINNLFVKVNSHVQEASDIFSRNVEMKKILDNRFEELKKLQSEIETTRKANYDEINNYKEEVINKLTAKKEEIEEKLELLKNLQSEFEKEKNEFESYKKDEIVKIEKMRKEEETSFEERRNELNKIEDKLRKQKDFLEEEKRQLSLDQIKYETDKNELANNMIKFNEIVSKFTSGIDGIN